MFRATNRRVRFRKFAGVEEARKNLKKLENFLKSPANLPPLAHASLKGCCSLALQERVRRSSHVLWLVKLACHSSVSAVPNLWKCLLELAPVACAISLTRLNPIALVSSSLTKTIPPVATVVP